MVDKIERILLATGQDVIHKVVAAHSKFEVVGVVDDRSKLEETIRIKNPTVVLTGEGLPGVGNLPDIILSAAGANPYARFIYLTGEVLMDDERRIEPLRRLIRAGIYDIVHSRKMNKKELLELLVTGKTYADVQHFLKAEVPKQVMSEPKPLSVASKSKTALMGIESGEDMDATIISFSSIKPGSGKSFLASNVATAIAQFSTVGENKRKPRVAIVDGDLQNVSIGTLFGVDDNESYLMRCMKGIGTLLNKSGKLIAGPDDIQDVNALILKSMTSYSEVKNLYILAGSQEEYDDLIQIPGFYYAYLIDALKMHYDYIIIDSNSSLSHITTLPILKKSDVNYYILNLDFNNVRNNIRYKNNLKNWEVLDKVRYILNEDTTDVQSSERVAFGVKDVEASGFTLDVRVPLFDKVVTSNRIYEGVPIILDYTTETYPVREPILQLANDIITFRNEQIRRNMNGRL